MPQTSTALVVDHVELGAAVRSIAKFVPGDAIARLSAGADSRGGVGLGGSRVEPTNRFRAKKRIPNEHWFLRVPAPGSEAAGIARGCAVPNWNRTFPPTLPVVPPTTGAAFEAPGRTQDGRSPEPPGVHVESAFGPPARALALRVARAGELTFPFALCGPESEPARPVVTVGPERAGVATGLTRGPR